MAAIVDNLIAFRVLYMLVTPFDQTDAFKYGIIDANGIALKKTRDLKTTKEKESYTNLHKLVFSLKRLLAKVPGGKSQFASIVAAYWLIKEAYNSKTNVKLEDLQNTIDMIEQKNICLVEEELLIEKFIVMMEDGAIANVTGSSTSTDQAAVRLKRGKPVSGIMGGKNYILRRKKSIQMRQ